MFSNRTTSKHYWAITVGIPTFEEGEINIPIGEAKLLGGYRIVTRPDLSSKSSEVWKLLIIWMDHHNIYLYQNTNGDNDHDHFFQSGERFIGHIFIKVPKLELKLNKTFTKDIT